MDAQDARLLERTARPPRSRPARRGRPAESFQIFFEKETQMNTATLIEPGTVKMERLLPGPVERVWAYITDSKKRSLWLAAGEFDLRVGGEIRLQFDNSK